MYGAFDHSWMFGGSMLLGGIWMLLLWVIPLLALFALVKYLFVKPPGGCSQEQKPANASPLDILKSAYARGDIDREEYLRKRNDLLEP